MKKIHYSWLVCFGCALLLFCTSGLSVNAFTIYQPYILKQNHFTNAQSSAIITVRSLFSFLAMFLTGKYYQKLSLRAGMGLAGGLTALGFGLFGIASSYPAYCLAAVAVGFGFGFGTMIPIAIVLKRWFNQKRNFAIGLCSAVTGLSTLGIPSLLTWMIETFGLRFTFLAEGACIAVLVAVSIFLIRDDPAQKGMQPYGLETSGQSPIPSRPSEGIAKKHWLLLLPMLLLLGAMTSVGYSHLSVLVSTAGFSAHITALAITVSGVMMTLSKCAFGWTADHLGTWRSNWIFGSVVVSGLVLCCCITGGSTVILFAAMCLYGAGLAVTTVGPTAWAGDLSTPETYDANVRRFQLYSSAGTLLFSSVPGILADHLGGSYIPAYMLFTAFAVFVLLSVQWLYHHFSTKAG